MSIEKQLIINFFVFLVMLEVFWYESNNFPLVHKLIGLLTKHHIFNYKNLQLIILELDNVYTLFFIKNYFYMKISNKY